MKMKQLLNELKAKLLLMTEPISSEVAMIDDIPKKWSKFMDSECEWKGIDAKLDSTTLLFRGVKGDKVGTHLHANSNERAYVLKGKLELVTEKSVTIFYEGESFYVPMNVCHIVNFLEDTTLLVVFSPKMNKLEIDFTK
jgi:quercetin dioxygenase-like cupin family protein